MEKVHSKVLLRFLEIYRVVQKKLWCDLEEKCFRNSKMFFDGVFLSIYSYLLKKLELSKLCTKKLLKIPHNISSRSYNKLFFGPPCILWVRNRYYFQNWRGVDTKIAKIILVHPKLLLKIIFMMDFSLLLPV